MPTLVGTQKWKPDKEELEKELRRLGLAKEDVRITKLEDEIVLDPENPIENVSQISLTLPKNSSLIFSPLASLLSLEAFCCLFLARSGAQGVAILIFLFLD